MWQPIETAPKDGTAFLAVKTYDYMSPAMVVMHYSKFDLDQEVLLVSWDHDDGFEPSHWMPLPDPPA